MTLEQLVGVAPAEKIKIVIERMVLQDERGWLQEASRASDDRETKKCVQNEGIQRERGRWCYTQGIQFSECN